MFKNLKSKAKSLFSKIIMSVFALSFLSFGASSYFLNTPKSIAITVNGEEVSVSELQTSYDKRKSAAERQFGGKLSPEYLEAIRLGNITVNDIITEKLTLAEAKSLGFRASEKALQQEIKNNSTFKDSDGNFSKEIYKNAVQNYGYSVRGFENLIAEDMQKKNLYSIFTTPFSNKAYLENLYNFENEKIAVRVLHINEKSVGKITAPTASEIKSYYDENAHRFLTDEMRDFNTLVLNANDLKNRINISEEEMRTIYNENPESFSSDEQRKASHILVDSEVKALKLIDRLDKGASFELLAKQNSKDAFTKSKGGNLGFFLEKDMVESFSEAAFSMNKGAISEPIKSPFGYHVIQLNDIKEPASRSFEEVKLEIEAELKIEKAEDLYYDLLENIEDQVSAGANLEEIAASSELTLGNYTQIKANNTSMTFSADIMPVVFASDDMETSDAIGIQGQDTVTAFIQITKITKPRELTIDESRKRIITELKETAKQKLITAKAEALLVERQNASSLNYVASKHGLNNNVELFEGIGRTNTGAPKWLKQLHVNLLFTMEPGTQLNSIINTPNSTALVELVSIKQNPATDEDLAYFKSKIAADMQDDLFSQYMMKKRLAADIDLNIPSIQSTLGSGYVK